MLFSCLIIHFFKSFLLSKTSTTLRLCSNLNSYNKIVVLFLFVCLFQVCAPNSLSCSDVFFSPLHSSGVTATASLVMSHWIKMHMDLERQNSTQIRWLKRVKRKPPFNLRSAVWTVWMMWVIRLQRPMSIVRHGGAVLFCVWNLLVGELWCQHGVKQAINALLH